MSRVIGLDISPTSTGFCLADDSVTDTYAIQVPSSVEWMEMVKQICLAVVKGSLHCPVFIEDYAFGSFGGSSSIKTIAEINGAVKFFIVNKVKREFYTVAPTTVKKFVTGSGKAPKDVMRLAAYKKYGIEFETNDEVDAYCIADFGYHVINEKPKRKLLKHELETLKNYKERLKK